jgi:Tol biopolymer transport system component
VSDRAPAFSPDGTLIAFARAHRQRPYSMGGWTWDQWDVCIVRPDGTGLGRVTGEMYPSLDSARFGRDGKQIVYSAGIQRGDGRPVTVSFETDIADRKPPQILLGNPESGDAAVWASHPTPTPGGPRVVFVSDRAEPYHYDLLVAILDGKNPRHLGVTAVSRYNQRPVVSRDGKAVYFLAGTEWNARNRPIYSLWRVDLDAGRPTQVAGSGLFTNPMSWSPGR